MVVPSITTTAAPFIQTAVTAGLSHQPTANAGDASVVSPDLLVVAVEPKAEQQPQPGVWTSTSQEASPLSSASANLPGGGNVLDREQQVRYLREQLSREQHDASITQAGTQQQQQLMNMQLLQLQQQQQGVAEQGQQSYQQIQLQHGGLQHQQQMSLQQMSAQQMSGAQQMLAQQVMKPQQMSLQQIGPTNSSMANMMASPVSQPGGMFHALNSGGFVLPGEQPLASSNLVSSASAFGAPPNMYAQSTGGGSGFNQPNQNMNMFHSGFSTTAAQQQSQQPPPLHLPPRPHLLEVYFNDLSLTEDSGFPEKSYFSSSRYGVRGRTLPANQPLAQIRWPAKEREITIREDIGKCAVISEPFEKGKKEESHPGSSSTNCVSTGGSSMRIAFKQASQATSGGSSSSSGLRTQRRMNASTPSTENWEVLASVVDRDDPEKNKKAVASSNRKSRGRRKSASNTGDDDDVDYFSIRPQQDGTAALREFSSLDADRTAREPDLILLRPEARHEFLLLEVWLLSESLTSSEQRLVGRVGIDLRAALQGLAYTLQEHGHPIYSRDLDIVGRIYLRNLMCNTVPEAIHASNIRSEYQARTEIELEWMTTTSTGNIGMTGTPSTSSSSSSLHITSYSVFRLSKNDRSSYELVEDNVRNCRYLVADGLKGNTEYSFHVTANNACGVGMLDAEPFVVRTAPTEPDSVEADTVSVEVGSKDASATATTGSTPPIDLCFPRPRSDGGSPLLFFRVWMCKVPNCSWWTDVLPKNPKWVDMGSISAYDGDAKCDTFRCRITPTEKTARYSFKIFAVNRVGYSKMPTETKCVYV
ncbi:unnamed protein product [Amoebophrya sp. A25]|nr:unnamed protein product [Amoebophrya sp. A25]|eukprot:GSA25T00025631001.1